MEQEKQERCLDEASRLHSQEVNKSKTSVLAALSLRAEDYSKNWYQPDNQLGYATQENNQFSEGTRIFIAEVKSY